MHMASGNPVAFKVLTMVCLPECDRMGRSVGCSKLLRNRAIALHTVSLFLPSVQQSQRSAGNSNPSLGQVHVSIQVTFPRDPFSSVRFLFTPFFLKFWSSALTSGNIGFRTASWRFIGAMYTVPALKEKSSAVKRKHSVMRRQRRWDMTSAMYNHALPCASTCFNHKTQSWPGRVAALPNF